MICHYLALFLVDVFYFFFPFLPSVVNVDISINCHAFWTQAAMSLIIGYYHFEDRFFTISTILSWWKCIKCLLADTMFIL